MRFTRSLYLNKIPPNENFVFIGWIALWGGEFVIQPLRHGSAVPPPLAQGRLGWCRLPCGGDAQQLRGHVETIFIFKAPLCKGSCLR